jgi:hypothetical protein
MVMCSVVKADGMPCKAHAKKDHIFCATHLRQKEIKLDKVRDDASMATQDLSSDEESAAVTQQKQLPVVMHNNSLFEPKKAYETPSLDALTAQVSDVQQMIARMESMIIGKGKKQTVKPKQITEKGLLRKAKFMFYHDNKTHKDILGEIVPRLESAGLLFKRKSVVEGVEVFKDVIPWQMVKEGTDALFETLPDESRDLYLEKARIVMTM